MINNDEARAIALLAIAELMGHEYFRTHFEGSCESFRNDYESTGEYEYFLGFEGDEESNLWTVFARLTVDLSSEKVTFLDYRTPDGTRMPSPIKPVRLA